jgi:sigma-E factor negative regulatory protein RseB
VLRSDEGDDPTTVCGPCPGELAGLVRYDARRVRIGSAAGVHLSYSDGLSTVSVFAQPGRLDPPRTAGLEPATLGGWPVWARSGLPDQVVWSAAGTVYTVVSDAPAGTLEDVVAALPHEPDPAPLLLRLERGASRVISWLDPSR